ncbi:hypothetical protein HY839_02395 [Candidatus Azambacteria bacterium]|nr:hypothetical protein [Candidatus Azambacteria bacterium]
MEREKAIESEEEKDEDRELVIGDNLEVKTKKLEEIEKKWDEHEKKD